MSTTTPGPAAAWVRVTREDGETVGWLEALDAGYELLRPRDVLGHVVAADAGWAEAEEAVQARGLSHLAERWTLDADPRHLAIVEVTPERIVVADWMRSRALAPSESISLPWPDCEGRLRRA